LEAPVQSSAHIFVGVASVYQSLIYHQRMAAFWTLCLILALSQSPTGSFGRLNRSLDKPTCHDFSLTGIAGYIYFRTYI